MAISSERVQADAEAVHAVILGGGVAIVPLDVAYAIVGMREAALRRIFAVKRRSFEKPSGMIACLDHSLALHDLGPREREIVRVVVEEYDLPISVVAPFDARHPSLHGVDPWVVETSSKAGTLDMLLNAGALHNALARLCFERGTPAFGSSANVSLTGSKFTVDEIEPELIEAADIVIDHGRSKYANPEGVSSTIIDFRDFSVVRRGCIHDRLEAVFRERFGIDLRPAAAVSGS